MASNPDVPSKTGTVLTQHVLRDGGAEDVTSKLAGGPLGVNSRRPLEDLNDGLGAGHLQNLPSPETDILI